jgi:hypothetical protein
MRGDVVRISKEHYAHMLFPMEIVVLPLKGGGEELPRGEDTAAAAAAAIAASKRASGPDQ